jgi:hypothetical protein
VTVAAIATREAEGALAGGSPGAKTRPRLFEPGGTTLEDVILASWNDLVAERSAECPVCGDSMSLLSGCPSCGSELS